MSDTDILLQKQNEDMPSLNHSYICSGILRQLFQNDAIEALSELTLDIDNGLTPDISVYAADAIKPNFLRDIKRIQNLPILSVEVISASQNIQDILEKAERMVKAGIKAVWTVEPFSKTIFVSTDKGEDIFYNQSVESEGIRVDFKKIFESQTSKN